MIVTEIYDGQGLGNQLWCYVTTRVIAADRGCAFGIQSPAKLKCREFLDLDLGQPVIGGSGPEGGPPRQLPEGVQYYYNERRIEHPDNGVDIRIHDEALTGVPDGTKIDGVMQDEAFIRHRRDEIRAWLQIKDGYSCKDYAADDICVINFRGGEYKHIERVFLPSSYWQRAMEAMRGHNARMRFVVITDDIAEAKKFFPELDVFHFGIAKDYAVLSAAHFLILSNSSFAFFPAWLNRDLRFCIAPKYWSQYNYSDGYWGCGYNLTDGWHYLDRSGSMFTYEECRREFDEYRQRHAGFFVQKRIDHNFLVVSNYYNDLSWVPEYTDDYLVYDQSDVAIHPPKLDPSKVIRSPHLGHNIRDYCAYIIDHYDELPERVIFATGNVFPRHIPRTEFDRLVNNAYFTPLEDRRRHQVSWPVCFFAADGGFCEINNSWYLNHHPSKYFHYYDDFLRFCFAEPVIPRYIRFAPGANYIVPREQILKYPRGFYDNLRTFVSHSPNAIPGESHIIERALHTIWTANFRLNEAASQPIDPDRFSMGKAPSSVKQGLRRRLAVFLGTILGNQPR